MRLYAAAATLAAALPACAPPALMAAPALATSACAESWSSYWFRGETITDRWTLQPSMTLSAEEWGLDLTVWGSLAVQDRARLEGQDEVDFILEYSRPLELGRTTGSITLGVTEYVFTRAPSGESRTEEASLGIALDGLLAPSATAAYDFGIVDEPYFEASVEPEFDLGRGFALALCAGAGAAGGGEPFGLRDLFARASVSVPAGPVVLSPAAGYGYAPDGPAEGAERAFFGVSLSWGE
jgi:hypothetical protein